MTARMLASPNHPPSHVAFLVALQRSRLAHFLADHRLEGDVARQIHAPFSKPLEREEGTCDPALHISRAASDDHSVPHNGLERTCFPGFAPIDLGNIHVAIDDQALELARA